MFKSESGQGNGQEEKQGQLWEHFDLHVGAELFEIFRVEILGSLVLCFKLWNISLKAIYYATKLDD